MSGDLASAHKCRIKRLSAIFNFDVTAMQTEVYRDKIGHGTTPTVHNSLKWRVSSEKHCALCLTRWEVRFLPKLLSQTKYELSKIINI